MTQCYVPELQDLACEALHHMMLSSSGVDVLNKVFEMDLGERLIHLLDSKSVKTREVGLHCILDIVELGNKAFLESGFFSSRRKTCEIRKIGRCLG